MTRGDRYPDGDWCGTGKVTKAQAARIAAMVAAGSSLEAAWEAVLGFRPDAHPDAHSRARRHMTGDGGELDRAVDYGQRR